MKNTLLTLALSLAFSNSYNFATETKYLTADNCPQGVLEEILAWNLETPFKVQKGDKIKLSFLIEGGLISLDEGDQHIYLTFHEDFYLKQKDNNIFFSQDGVTWRGFENFFQGGIFFTLFGNEENKAESALVLKVDLEN